MRLVRACLALILLSAPLKAAEVAEIDRLWDLMRMDEVVSVMREEGLAYGASLDADMLAGTGGSGFTQLVEGIYDTGRMGTLAQARFREELAGADVAPMLDFFEDDLGERVIALELSARRALLDPEIEAAARERVAEMGLDGDPRLALIDRFVEVNDLVESNVMGALNSSYAFYAGMADGGGLGDDTDEGQMLSDVWSQEPEIRTETQDWVYGFLTMAYQPLSDEELTAYVEFSDTAAGQELNRAIFVAFDEMFVGISRALGASVARFLIGQEL